MADGTVATVVAPPGGVVPIGGFNLEPGAGYEWRNGMIFVLS
jgi:hypothetical protein